MKLQNEIGICIISCFTQTSFNKNREEESALFLALLISQKFQSSTINF